ncbi:hypothetical protein [Nonomuraea sp. B1E8]|uniref:hypothetical protein n=1 Tax=unclassified Nonomuraea TaxID=2593643 RepID=UPI00325EE8AF
MTLTLALVPLGERPACATLPREIAAVAGARLGSDPDRHDIRTWADAASRFAGGEEA